MNNLDKFYQGCKMKTTKLIMIIGIVTISPISLKAQVSVSNDGSIAHHSVVLEVKSTEKFFLLSRMTQAERDLIPSPAAGRRYRHLSG